MKTKTVYMPQLAYRYYSNLSLAIKAVDRLIVGSSRSKAFVKFLDELVHSVGEEKFTVANLNNIICRFGPHSLVSGLGESESSVLMTFQTVLRRRHLYIILSKALIDDDIVSDKFSVTVHRPGSVPVTKLRMSPEIQAVLDGVWHAK